MTALYLDFIWEHLALPEADVVDIYDFIPSCNPRDSDVMVSLQSAYADYNIQSQQFYFPTTDYFLQQWREGDIPDISICDEYSEEAFPFYTCLANYLDVLELYRYAENASDLLSGFPLEFAPRIQHLTIETDYRPEKISPNFQTQRFSYDESTGLYKNELGYIGDTASALNVNVESECIEFQQEDRPNTVTVGLYSDQSEFEFCKFSPMYGGLWASDKVDASILGNSVVLSPGTSFVNHNLNGASSLSFSVPYIFQGGLPIIQMFNLDGVRLNACIDSGSASSFYSRRYDRRLLPRDHGIELYFSGLDSSPSIVLGSLGSTHDGLLQCDLILGADTLSKFNSVKIGDMTIEIIMPRKSD
ncbi:hypothetical protein CWE15_11065 [Aliidiomarina taiwanensis]|uniref:Uncharacterized protein n=1 Tax=Aliidiomarina taiwanensis TaxID=946228 RepID=A0A432WVM4_9GAMM|nr:hypothetical protein [Aliidiomarina taiwanensis]RUO37823.1 hypothetical protein CWE15_11065 [Aliidiomarina taiwanensis]